MTKKWDEMERIIRKTIDDMCPLKTFKIKQEKEPWISNQLIELIKDKDYALSTLKKEKILNYGKRQNNYEIIVYIDYVKQGLTTLRKILTTN